MIYIIEAYSKYSKIQRVEETYHEAKKHFDYYHSLGYTTSITPKDITLVEYGLALEHAVKEMFTDKSN